jgi:uncharacterized cupin superfamily protein
LRELVAPLDEHLFLASCFRRCAVHAPASTAGPVGERRLKLLRRELFDLDPASILTSTASENIFIWLRHNNGGGTSLSGNAAPATPLQHRRHDLIESIEVGDPDTALVLHRAGHATYCRAPPAMEHWLVSSLLSSTGLGCGQFDPTGESSTCLGRGEVEIFQGTPGHFTNWHWDFQENFTVQLSGVKRWTLRKGPVPHPLRGCTPHYRSPEAVEPQLKAARLVDPDFEFGYPTGGGGGGDADEEEQVVTLRPGDVLYFPAGMWHKVEVIEAGASLNVSLMAANYASITCQALQHLLLQRSEWRECVASNSSVEVTSHLRGLLRQLPSIIEEFERKGGADAILPPAVRDCSAAAARPRLKMREADEPEASDSEHDDDDDVGDVIDVTRERTKPFPYECTETQLRDRFRTHRVVRNPLAAMMRERDILRFYKTGDNESDDDGGGSSPEVYVLNVNYAGNESHESLVRARILGTGSLLSHVFRYSVLDGGPSGQEILPDVESWIRSEAERSMLGCLVYYGFLVWIPREVN